MPKAKKTEKKGELLRHAPLETDLNKPKTFKQKSSTGSKKSADRDDDDITKQNSSGLAIKNETQMRRMEELMDRMVGARTDGQIGFKYESDGDDDGDGMQDEEDFEVISLFKFPRTNQYTDWQRALRSWGKGCSMMKKVMIFLL